MENIFLHLLNMSLTAGVLVVAVVLLRGVFHKAPRWLHCLLWALVAVRLVCPFAIESNLSLMPKAAVSVSKPDTTPVEQVIPDTPDTPSTEVIVPDTPVPNTPIVDTPVVTPPVVDPPAVDTPVVTPPVVNNTPAETPSADAAVSTAAPEVSVDPWQIVLTVATYVWLAGVALMAVYAAVTTLRLRRRVRESAHLEGNLWQCDHIRSPFILGVFRPRIYLPSDLNGMARDSVVAHEHAHLHRRDHWWKPLGFLLLTVYWFNPLMWVAYILLCRDIEAACDERVVRDMNAEARRSYSEALLLCSAPRRLVSACPLAFGETSVKSRIKSVLSYKKPTVWILVVALLVSMVAGVCLLTDPKDKPAKKADSQTDITDKPSDSDDNGSSADRTAPLGLTHVIRTGLIDTGFEEYFGSLGVQQFTARADLLAFLNAHHEEDMHWANVDWQIRDFDQFDDAFFADNVLLLTYHGTSSGMITPEVVSYTYLEDGTVLTVGFVEYHPSFVTTDLGAWLMFSGIKKTDLKGVTTVTSHLLKEIPTDTYVAAFTESTEHPETATEKWREFYEDGAGRHLREMLTRLNDGGWVEDPAAINRALSFVGCVWMQGDIYYVTDQFDAIMSKDGKVGWLTAEESVRVSWLFDGEEDPVYQMIAKAKKVDGNHVLMECVESEWLTDNVWVDFSRFSASTVKIGENYRIFYDYMELTDPPRIKPIRVMLAPVNGITTTPPPTTTTTAPTTTAKPTTEPTTTTTAPTTPAVKKAVVGDTYVVGGIGTWREEILKEVYPDYVVSYPLQSYPIKVLYTYEELSDFLARYAADDRYLKQENFTRFNAAWFAENALLMTYYENGTYSVHPQIGAYTYSVDGTILSVGIDVHAPPMGDAALGAWYMFSGIKKVDLEDVTKVTAYVREQIPESNCIALFAEPTSKPQNAVEEWRTWIPDEESSHFSQLTKSGRFVVATRACKYIAVINEGGHNYYISEDFAAIQRDDGKLYWMTESDAESIRKLIAAADENRILYEQ